MPGPFPGMDPYLEDPAFWPDFHQRFITYCCDAVAEVLPDNYEARIDEQMNLVELPPEEVKRIRPDLAITQRRPSMPIQNRDGGTLTLEPIILHLPIMEEVREARIHIVQRSNRRLISVLELLSPSNKTEPGRGDYLAKRMAVIRQGVHLVELDLLVGGQRLPTLEPLPSGDYYAFVVRADRRPDIDVFAWTVRQKLPPIPVPLKAPDPDVTIDLSGVFAVAYERGRYRRSIDYHEPLHVPLSSEKLKWALEQAKAISS